MAKGKKNKKGGDKKQEPIESDLSALSLASTSQASTSQDVQTEESSGGLTGGARPTKHTEKAQKVIEPAPEPSIPPTTPVTSEAAEEPSEPATKDDKEEGAIGLEQPKTKRIRTRKKKPSLAQAEAQVAPSAQGPTGNQPPSQGPPQARPGPQPATQWGVPQPSSQGPSQARQGPPPSGQWGPAQPSSQGPPSSGQWGAAQPSSQGPPQARQGPPPSGQWGAAQPSSQGPPQARQGPPPSGQWGAAQPSSQGPPQARQGPPPSGQWGAPQPSSQGPPQARQGPPPSGQWGAPPLSQGPPGSFGQRGPSSGSSQAPSQSGAGPAQRAQSGAVRQETSSAVSAYSAPRQQPPGKYTIPAKIVGKSIRCRLDRVITNYLPMTIKAIPIHRYDVAFEPSRPKKMIPMVFKMIKDKYYPNEYIAFDQVKNFYSLRALKNLGNSESKNKDEIKFSIDFPDPNDRIITFEVVFKMTGVVDLGRLHEHLKSQGSSLNPPTDAIQCIDVVLRQGALESYVRSGRNFFKRPERPLNLGGCLEMWTGLFQSAIFTSAPFINVDVAHKGFPIHQTMIEAWKSMKMDINKPLESHYPRDAEAFRDFVKNLKVLVKILMPGGKHQTREYSINSVVDIPGKLFFHNDQTGKDISVLNYYRDEKKYNIQYPHLPCLWVGPRNKTMYFPMELATVAYGQTINKQLNEMQLSNMVREAATPPHIRKQKIEECVRSMNYSTNNFFKAFGLEISNKFMEVDAKILQPPILAVGEGTAQPRNGSWNASKLLQPEALAAWGLLGVELSRDQCNYEGIASLVLQVGTQLGMTVKPPMLTEFNVRLHDLRRYLMRAAEMNIRLLYIIVSTRGRDHYHKVKQLAECDVGILTQCIKENTATRRMNPQTMKNILLKVNSKLMGINQSLNGNSLPRCLQSGGVMVVGADVTHPAPDSNIPSIAAVTASIDPKCFIYNIEMSIQEPKTEMILQFQDMMADHLKIYMERNGRQLPKKIYVFRDGVSEGQFKEVMENELTALYRAYERFSKEKPEVLFLIVQKRHHTRLFAQAQGRGIVNVEPGTVVDTQIVHPKEMDFYLVSHQAIKGTARPTRYHAICNDGRIPTDEVEQLTYYLCHLYSRCMRSVSYPTPTYYAHLACLRARSLTYGQTFDIQHLRQQPKRLRVMDKMLRSSRMFFV